MEVNKKDIKLTEMTSPSKEMLVNWIKQWFDRFAPEQRAVVYISGTQESAVCAALFVEALGKDRVIGVTAPNLRQQHTEKTKQLIDLLEIEGFTVPISIAVASIHTQIEYEGIPISWEAARDLPERVRHSVLYAIAQSVNGMVVDIRNSPIAGFTQKEILTLGRELNLPDGIMCSESM